MGERWGEGLDGEGWVLNSLFKQNPLTLIRDAAREILHQLNTFLLFTIIQKSIECIIR